MISIITPCHNYEHLLPEAVESVQNQTYKHFEHLILHDGCGGKSEYDIPQARNLLVAKAKGEYVVNLDADDKLHPDFLADLIPYAGPRTIVCPYLKTFPKETIHIPGNITYDNLYKNNLLFACSLYPKTLWAELGGYDEKLSGSFEDWDFWLRAVKAGYHVKVVPKVLYYYRLHDSHTTKATNALIIFRNKYP